MAKRKIFGLASVLIGAIAADGGMGAVLIEVLGATVKGSASLIYTPPSTSDIEIEEDDSTFDTLITTPGKWELKLESYNLGAKTMNDVGIGTLTLGVAPAPDKLAVDDIIQKESSFRLTTRNGAVIDLPRVKYIASPSLNFDKTQLAKLVLTGSPLKPTKAGVSTVLFTDGNS